MSQVQPNRGAGQRQPTGNRRPPSVKPKPGGPAGRGQGPGGRGPGKGGGGRGPRPGASPGRAPRRFSPATVGFVAVAVVVLVVVVLVVVKVTGGSSNTNSSNTAAVKPTPAPASLVHQVTSVPDSVLQSVGVPSSVPPPKLAKGQPALTAAGKPQVLFIGAEFCPYCAAERWALVVAFSRFGTFSGLDITNSSPFDVDPATATFSFRNATYTSSLVDFTMVEHETNDTTAVGTRSVLQKLTTAQQILWTKYSAQFGVQTGYPFIDFGNKVFVLGPAYNPQILSGLDQGAIAAKLASPTDPVAQAILGEANYLTAAICSLTGGQPSAVCSASATTDAAKAIGLS